MVYSNGFAVKIITEKDHDKLKRDTHNYVALHNNTEYKIKLINDRSTDAMADVQLEGEMIGSWFIPARESITIERPGNVSRKFTFFRETDARPKSAGVRVGSELNGLIRVIFYPKKAYITVKPSSPKYYAVEKRQPISLRNASVSSPVVKNKTSFVSNFRASPNDTYTNTSSYQSGATVLGSESLQRFGMRTRFLDDEIDWENRTEITIRLVAKPDIIKYSSSKDSLLNPFEHGIYEITSPINANYTSIKNSVGEVPPRIDQYFSAI